MQPASLLTAESSICIDNSVVTAIQWAVVTVSATLLRQGGITRCAADLRHDQQFNGDWLRGSEMSMRVKDST